MLNLKSPRRSEFAACSLEVLGEILRGARYGHLAHTDGNGLPEIRPLNYAHRGKELFFHTSPKGELSTWRGPATFAVEDSLCWLPSYWRNQELACPATTYYRSALVRGSLRPLTEEEKPDAMQAFMERYQPEGGHLPITAANEVYRAPLAALSLLALSIDDFTCKAKFGQHLTETVRMKMVEALADRRRPGDLVCAQSIRRYNECPEVEGWTWDPTAIPAEGIWELLAPTYWGHRRTRLGVEEQRDQAWMVLGFLEKGRLLAYVRLHRVDARTAFLYDVIVAPDQRARGLGKELMARLMARAAPETQRIFLDTRDAMGLYARHGFVTVAQNSLGSSTMLWQGDARA